MRCIPTFFPDGKHIAYIADRKWSEFLGANSWSDVEVLPEGHGLLVFRFGRGGFRGGPTRNGSPSRSHPAASCANVAVAPAEGGRPPVRVAPAGEDQGEAIWSNDGAFLMWGGTAGALHGA